MRYLTGLAAAILATGLAAADQKVELNGENTTITFVGSKPEGKHTGGFKQLTGTATVGDGSAGVLQALDVTIDIDSIFSDDEKLTGHLKSPDFFDVKTNPTAKFTTKRVIKTPAGYQVVGDLTMNGKTNTIQFPAQLAFKDGTLTINADFTIDRTKFGMTYGKGKIHDEVSINVKVEAKR